MNAYYRECAKALSPKLFFLDLPAPREGSFLVDFGCGDGTVLKYAMAAWPGVVAHGIERDPEARAMAALQCPDATIMANEDHLPQGSPQMDDILVLSSVMHEVWSQRSLSEFLQWWARIAGLGYKYIAIRDMGVSLPPIGDRPPMSLAEATLKAIAVDPVKAAEHQQKYGSMFTSLRSLTHWLLKVPHLHDWEREHAEDYLRYGPTELAGMLTAGGAYKLRYVMPERVHYFEHRVLRDFGVRWTTPTHFRMILERSA